VEEARRRTLAEGLNGLLEVVRPAEGEEQASWIGRLPMRYVRQLDGAQELVWRTEPVPPGLDPGARHTFHFPAALGYRSQPAGSFRLFLGELPLLEFDVSLGTTTWRSADGQAVLRYSVKARSAEDSSGPMELELPASLLEPGKPATLRVTGSASGSRRWFGLLLVR
jgi:hypothetical protein